MNYKDNNRKAERWREHIHADLLEHFASHGQNVFLEDCIITLIDQTDGTDLTRREEYCKRVLKTVSPYGLNTVARSSIFLPGFHTFFGGKSIIKVKCLI